MSLQRVLAPPPLALAVHPAPPPKTREEIRKEDEKRRADREAKHKAEAEAKAKADAGEKKDDADKRKEEEKDDAEGKREEPAKSEVKDKADEIRPTDPKADTPPKPEVPLPPLRLLPPVPHRPVRSRLDLDPARPYPPINSDPRGAYNAYAKAMQKEVLLIDVTKDGWLTEQWRGKAERDALARLSGDAERQRMREVAKAQRECMVRKVPATADGLILELWNDLVEAEANELSIEAFWARYDWSDPKAEKHLQVMPFEEKERMRLAEIKRVEEEVKAEEAATLARRAAREKARLEEEVKAKRKKEEGDKGGDKDEGEKKDDEKKEDGKKHEDKPDVDKAKNVEKEEVVTEPKKSDEQTKAEPAESEKAKKPVGMTYKYPVEVEWTKEGVEEILATVGIQCAFNTERPLPRHWSTPSAAYLLIAHNHFLLRTESDITFKPDGPSEKFEVLMTSAEDRVFGPMVKAQMKKKDKEYRDRKEKEYVEKKEKERKERKEKGEGKDDEKKGDKEAQKDDQKDGKKDEKDGGEAKNKEKVGEADVKPDLAAHADGDKAEKKVMIAVPVKDSKEAPKGLDEKHEEEPVVVGPKVDDVVAELEEEGKAEAKVDEKEGDKGADKDKKLAAAEEAKHRPHKAHGPPAAFDPVRDADLLIKMLGPDAANIPLADLKAAFAAMEHAAADQKAQAKAVGDKKDGPMVWVWHEPCERWRWRIFAAGCAVIEEGGWEERDWKVFADDRGVVEYDEEMGWEEILEKDIHDWGC